MNQQPPRPARGYPERETLWGAHGRLEPLDPIQHGGSLWRAAANAPSLWDFMPYGPFAEEEAFAAWLVERSALADPLSFAVVNRRGHALGLVTLMRMNPAHGVIETGHIVFAPPLQRTPLASEAIYLLARAVFDDLGYRRLEWKCDNLNAASKRAALRFGFSYEGVFRQHMIVKGRNRDTAWFSMLDREWPARRHAFERWLAFGNFDSEGRQRLSLSALNGLGAS